MKNPQTPTFLTALCVTLLLAGVASAAPLVSFNMNDVPQDTPMASYVTTTDGDPQDFGTAGPGVQDVTVSLGADLVRQTYNTTFGARKS